MKWRYTILWLDGTKTTYLSTRGTRPNDNRVLTIYVNEHGHDSRFDEIHVNMAATRSVTVEYP